MNSLSYGLAVGSTSDVLIWKCENFCLSYLGHFFLLRRKEVVGSGLVVSFIERRTFDYSFKTRVDDDFHLEETQRVSFSFSQNTCPSSYF